MLHNVNNGDSCLGLKFASSLCSKLGGEIKEKRLKKGLHTITIHLNVRVEKGQINERSCDEMYQANKLSQNSKPSEVTSYRNT